MLKRVSDNINQEDLLLLGEIANIRVVCLYIAEELFELLNLQLQSESDVMLQSEHLLLSSYFFYLLKWL